MAASNSGALNDGTTAKTRETSFPLIYIAAAVGIVGCIFGAFFLLGIWFFFIDVDKPEPVDEKIAVQIMASCDCSLTVDGKKEDSVNSVVYLKAGKHKIILTKNGKAYATRDVSLNTTKNFYLVQF